MSRQAALTFSQALGCRCSAVASAVAPLYSRSGSIFRGPGGDECGHAGFLKLGRRTRAVETFPGGSSALMLARAMRPAPSGEIRRTGMRST